MKKKLIRSLPLNICERLFSKNKWISNVFNSIFRTDRHEASHEIWRPHANNSSRK